MSRFLKVIAAFAAFFLTLFALGNASASAGTPASPASPVPPGTSAPPMPQRDPDVGTLYDGDLDCATGQVNTSQTTTYYTYAWDGSTWVESAEGVTEYGTRPMTSEELKACTPQPEPEVVTTEWVDGDGNCETKQVEQTRTVTTTPYVWDGSAWVLDEANAESTTEEQTRDMTSEELKACTPQPEPEVKYECYDNGGHQEYNLILRGFPAGTPFTVTWVGIPRPPFASHIGPDGTFTVGSDFFVEIAVTVGDDFNVTLDAPVCVQPTTPPTTPAPTPSPTEPTTPAPTPSPTEPTTPAPTPSPTEPTSPAPQQPVQASPGQNAPIGANTGPDNGVSGFALFFGSVLAGVSAFCAGRRALKR